MARKGIQLRIFFENLDGLGEIGLEKNSLNFYKCRGMSRFGEKKHRRKGICARLRAIDPQPQRTITKYELTILETPVVALKLIATRKYA